MLSDARELFDLGTQGLIIREKGDHKPVILPESPLLPPLPHHPQSPHYPPSVSSGEGCLHRFPQGHSTLDCLSLGSGDNF